MNALFPHSVPFYKMQGCGNDFVIIDNRSLKLDPSKMAKWAEALCKRAFGIYGDGLFFIDHAPEGEDVDLMWHFFNSDGSRAEMCGNASRCMGKLSWMLGIVGTEHSFMSDAGPIKVQVLPEQDEVKVQLTEPHSIKMDIVLDIDGREYTAHFADTGVPHAVLFLDDLQNIDIKKLGAAVRYHEAFAPAGTNVNFAQIVDKETVNVRTYERGVEDETYACGTGVSAVQLLGNKLGMTGDFSKLTTTGGETLTVYTEGNTVFLQGGAQLVFSGEMNLEALGLK
ncbi:MAG: diaminopimelate epimerase [Desulfovibrio sp.]